MTRDDALALTLRPITPEDEAFLFAVYASARRDELAQVPWDEAQKEAFLAFQFNAQSQHYQQSFSQADFDVVLRDGVAVGRLYVDRRADEIRILDIALLPEHQGRGLGRALLRDLLKEARAAGKPIRIYVESYQQRALRLFEDLGFGQKEDQGVSVLLEWTPGADG
jgi:ribosomal protein S18 acetylase RimI-like enzyme